MVLGVLKMYSYASFILHKNFKKNLPGLGFLLRNLIKKDVTTYVQNRKFIISSEVSDCYARMLIGKYNEPETHIFLKSVLLKLNKPTVFIDIGANIGEFLIDMALEANVSKVIGFEPNKKCYDACLKSLQANQIKSFKLIQKAVSFKESIGKMQSNVTNPHGGYLVEAADNLNSSDIIEVTTLKNEISDDEILGNEVIMLIDVEGFELQVMKGAKDLIAQKKPLIIFEYNYVSEKYFTIDEIKNELKDYQLYRLRSDGKLDQDFSEIWNLVAVSKNNEAFISSISNLVCI